MKQCFKMGQMDMVCRLFPKWDRFPKQNLIPN